VVKLLAGKLVKKIAADKVVGGKTDLRVGDVCWVTLKGRRVRVRVIEDRGHLGPAREQIVRVEASKPFPSEFELPAGRLHPVH
jgi:hypothetical protein